MDINMDEISLKLICQQNFNINISDTLINVLGTTWKSWSEKSPDTRKMTGARIHANFSTHKETGPYQPDANDEGVCPFSVKNETGMTIYLKKKKEMPETDEESIAIPKATTLDIHINYEETMENLLKAFNNNVKFTNTLFQVSFDPTLNYSAIDNIDFASIATKLCYLKKEKGLFNYLVCSLKLDRMQKLLTIRTPFELLNKTEFKFSLMFSKDSSEREYMLPVDEILSIPIEFMSSYFVISRANEPSQSLPQGVPDLLTALKTTKTVFIIYLLNISLV